MPRTSCNFRVDRKISVIFPPFIHLSLRVRPDEPLDFEQTIEQTLLDLRGRFLLRKCLFDPWQMQASAQRKVAPAVPRDVSIGSILQRKTIDAHQGRTPWCALQKLSPH
jgi:hypothetical protein